ncbi:MAG: sugar transferase [Elusimicrobia bacterium]|nr:sugar transferase [Elusimicrobiota bacterium]
MLVVLFFPLIFIAIAIKLSSDGPVFFKQERAGRSGKKFTLFKFRTMVDGAERMRSALMEFSDIEGPLFKMKKDPRVTPLGRFLRKSSLDELPQLINVLKGEMSLVGPRPHPMVEVQNYRPAHRQRLNVKPGMTGIWQVSGRSALSFERGIDLDLAYVHTLSWKLDMWILLRTVPAVILGKGAM